MEKLLGKIAGFALLIATMLWFTTGAWAQAPQITGFTTGVPGDNLYARGTLLIISGAFTTPSNSADYTILVGGQSGRIADAANGVFIVANIPSSAPVGSSSLVITYKGQASNALPITIVQSAPAFQGITYTITGPQDPPVINFVPFIRYPSGEPVTADAPARQGDTLETTVTGVGIPGEVPLVTISGQDVPAGLVSQDPLNHYNEVAWFFLPPSEQLGDDLVVLSTIEAETLPADLPVVSQSAPPEIFANGTVNAASLTPGNPPPALAPGSIATVFGDGLTDGSSCIPPCSQTVDANGILNTTLSGVQLTINGTPAPVLFTTNYQLGFQVPAELQPSGSATLEVTYGGQTSNAGSFNLAPFAPGIFTTGASGSGQGAILNGTEASEGISSLAAPKGNSPNAHPAQSGSVVAIYCTGLGAVSPFVATGALPTGQATVTQPTVTIGGLPATVQFSGLTPGDAGLYQINVVVPMAAPAGNSVPVVVTIGGAVSNTVTMAVQ